MFDSNFNSELSSCPIVSEYAGENREACLDCPDQLLASLQLQLHSEFATITTVAVAKTARILCGKACLGGTDVRGNLIALFFRKEKRETRETQTQRVKYHNTTFLTFCFFFFATLPSFVSDSQEFRAYGKTQSVEESISRFEATTSEFTD